MFFLDGNEASKILCSCEYEPVWNIVGFVIDFIKIGIPIVLIVLSMIDFAKAVIANKEDAQKKATKLLIKRFLYAIGVFASVWIVTLILDIVGGAFKNQKEYKYDEGSWKACWAIIEHNACDGDSQSTKEIGDCYLCIQNSHLRYTWIGEDKHIYKNCELVDSYKDKKSCEYNNKCYFNDSRFGSFGFIWGKPKNAVLDKYKNEEDCFKNGQEFITDFTVNDDTGCFACEVKEDNGMVSTFYNYGKNLDQKDSNCYSYNPGKLSGEELRKDCYLRNYASSDDDWDCEVFDPDDIRY